MKCLNKEYGEYSVATPDGKEEPIKYVVTHHQSPPELDRHHLTIAVGQTDRLYGAFNATKTTHRNNPLSTPQNRYAAFVSVNVKPNWPPV